MDDNETFKDLPTYEPTPKQLKMRNVRNRTLKNRTSMLKRYTPEAHENKTNTLHRKVKIGRNDPCPCRSGLKFKNCCERMTE